MSATHWRASRSSSTSSSASSPQPARPEVEARAARVAAPGASAHALATVAALAVLAASCVRASAVCARPRRRRPTRPRSSSRPTRCSTSTPRRSPGASSDRRLLDAGRTRFASFTRAARPRDQGRGGASIRPRDIRPWLGDEAALALLPCRRRAARGAADRGRGAIARTAAPGAGCERVRARGDGVAFAGDFLLSAPSAAVRAAIDRAPAPAPGSRRAVLKAAAEDRPDGPHARRLRSARAGLRRAARRAAGGSLARRPPRGLDAIGATRAARGARRRRVDRARRRRGPEARRVRRRRCRARARADAAAYLGLGGAREPSALARRAGRWRRRLARRAARRPAEREAGVDLDRDLLGPLARRGSR